ncbi:hypothetical protein ABC977_13585 [Thioalkalicoccus limnaeus]|uniref:Uncharacterized protein n=1 Tax=Thioalkalicoccus limnaeus TaxID=120681 RepID=A0ABV4BLU9_9GAMM
MKNPIDRYAAELLPSDYPSWRYCIEKKCGIPLTRDFIEERIRVLGDRNQEETRRFVQTYGHGHLDQVLGWFRQASEDQVAGR